MFTELVKPFYFESFHGKYVKDFVKRKIIKRGFCRFSEDEEKVLLKKSSSKNITNSLRKLRFVGYVKMFFEKEKCEG